MKLSQFNFNLPKELIAQEPRLFRDDCRLMVVHRKTGEIEYDEYVEPEPVTIIQSDDEKPKKSSSKKSKKVAEPVPAPVAEPVPEPVAEAKPAKKAAKKKAAEPAPELAAEPAPAPVEEAKPAKKAAKKKAAEPAPAPVAEPAPAPVEEAKPAMKAAKKKAAEPAPEPAPAPVEEAKPAKKAAKKKAAEPAPEPAPAPVEEVKPAKKAAKKKASEPAPEPAPAPVEEVKPAKKAAKSSKAKSKNMAFDIDDISSPISVKVKPQPKRGKTFRDVIDYFDENDLFVFNNTQVFPAKLFGNKERTGAVIEVFLLRELNPEFKLWDVLVEPARKIRIGNKLYFGEGENMVAEVIDNTTSRGRTLRFLYDGDHDQFKRELYELGQTPLPSYITREPNAEDAERYQTIFASREGAVVAPAAGAHFSRELLKLMEIKGIESAFLTIHSGLGNFRHIEVEDLTKHRMDSEDMEITPQLVEKVNATKDAGHKVCAVGASTLRALASAVSMNGHIKAYSGWTNKFIFPPYEFTVADAFITNFHQPYSVMLMEAAAFGGYDLIMKAYKIAIREKYKFGCYGDAMLIVD